MEEVKNSIPREEVLKTEYNISFNTMLSRVILPTKKNYLRNQFENYMKPVILSLRILGMNICTTKYEVSGDIKYKFVLPSVLYSVFIYTIVISCTIFSLSQSARKLLTSGEFSQIVIFVSSALDVIFVFIAPVVYWFETRKHSQYTTRWENFQVIYYKTTCDKLAIQRNRRFWIPLVFAVTYVIFENIGMFSFDGSYYEGGYLELILVTYIDILYVVLFFNWFFSCSALTKSAEQMTLCLSKELKSCYPPAEVIDRYKCLWLELSGLSRNLGQSFGYTYCTCLLYLFASLTFYVYVIIVGLKWNELNTVIVYFPDCLLILVVLFFICNCGYVATAKIDEVTRNLLLEKEMKGLERPMEKAVDVFLNRIESYPSSINLCGFATVNRSLIVSLGATVVTYIIVLIQLDMATPNGSLKSESTCKCNHTDSK